MIANPSMLAYHLMGLLSRHNIDIGADAVCANRGQRCFPGEQGIPPIA
jgi:hypothetical protein